MKHAFMSLLLAGGLTSCTTYTNFKEIRHVGFTDQLKKGKSVGIVKGDDCAFFLFGYTIGGEPNLNVAMANARTGKKTTVADSFQSGGIQEGGIRYLNDVKYEYTGFNLGIFGKRCIEVSGKGYK